MSDLNSNEYWQSPSFDGPPVRDPGEPNRWFRTLTIDDQPPGEYSVMPDAFVSGDGDPYGAVRVRVQAGDVVDVDFRRAKATAIPRELELQGTLRLIEGIDPARITLRFRPSNSQFGPSDPIRSPLDLRGDRLVMDRRDPQLAYWFAGSVPPGRWIASVPELGWSQEFDHVSDAAVALELTHTPSPARQSVRFRIVDGRTGRGLDHADIGIRVDGDPNPPAWDGASSTWTASILSGNARVFIRSHDLSAPDFEFEFAPENDTTTLTVWRNLQVEVRAYDGVARIGAPEIRELSPTIEPIGDAVVARYPSMTVSRVNAYTRNVTQPGRYRVTLPPNDRYAPHPPIEVVVKPDEPTPVAVFRLTRSAR